MDFELISYFENDEHLDCAELPWGYWVEYKGEIIKEFEGYPKYNNDGRIECFGFIQGFCYVKGIDLDPNRDIGEQHIVKFNPKDRNLIP